MHYIVFVQLLCLYKTSNYKMYAINVVIWWIHKLVLLLII